jgi:hypothetical protein
VTGIAEWLARARLSLVQLQAALGACIILSLAALIGVAWLTATRAAVARSEARRAVEQSEATQAQTWAADCRMIDLLRRAPGDPPAKTSRDFRIASALEGMSASRHCP